MNKADTKKGRGLKQFVDQQRQKGDEKKRPVPGPVALGARRGGKKVLIKLPAKMDEGTEE